MGTDPVSQPIAMNSSNVLTLNHVYPDNGEYEVVITVRDDDDGIASDFFSVTVDNAAPTLTVVGDQAAEVDVLLTLPDIGVFTGPRV